MRELPRGTVTLLFTDIEGSTRLLHRYGRDRYVGSLQTHRKLLRDSFGGRGGVEVEMQGDSFFFAFPSARDAVEAAADGQRALAAAEWDDGPAITVRVGLHTGEPSVSDGLYAGLDVHRAARVMSAAHGGQVLLSARTQDLVKGELPEGVRLRPLGRYLLKDFDGGEPLAQLEVDGLETRFPPVRGERQPTGPLRYVPRPARRHPIVAGSVVALAAAAVALPLALIQPEKVALQPNALAALDAKTGRALSVVPVGDTPAAIARVGRDLWVANSGEATVSRVDPVAKRVVRTIPVPGTPLGLAAGAGSLWVIDSDLAATRSLLSRIDLRYSQVTTNVRLPSSLLIGSGAGIAWDGRDVWAVTQAGSAFRVSPAVNRVVSSVPLGEDPIALAAAGGSVWAANRRDGSVSRIDSPGTVTATIPVGSQPTALAAAAGALWVADAGDDSVRKIDVRTGAVVASIHVGDRPEAIAASARDVWVGDTGDRTVVHIDAASNRVTKTIRLAYTPTSLAIDRGRVWVALQEPLPQQAATPRGKSLRLLTSAPGVIDSLDPPLAYTLITWEIEYTTCARLYNHADAPAPAGYRIVPEIAGALPRAGGDGRTYTIPIRDGYRFSPPSNQVVNSRTFKYSIERALAPKTKSFAVNFMSDIVGAREFEQGRAKHISGLIAKPSALVVRLERPAGDLAARLAMPFFCPVPLGTPLDFKGLSNVPSAGPYFVSSYVPNKQILLTRNPNYRGSRPHRSATIRITPTATEVEALAAVEQNRADAVIDAGGHVPIPKQFAKQVVRIPLASVHYLALNVARPTFADARMRRAVALAVDRAALGRFDSDLRPDESLLPPGFPGANSGRLFPAHGDVARARRLTHGRTRDALYVTCNRRECLQRAAELTAELARIGIRVHVKPLSAAAAFLYVSARGARFDITDAGWAADYVDPADFLVPIATAAGIRPSQSSNVAYFTAPQVEDLLARSAKLLGDARTRAFTKIERRLRAVDVPYVAYASETRPVLVSKRVGCVTANPVYGLDLGALCIKG